MPGDQSRSPSRRGRSPSDRGRSPSYRGRSPSDRGRSPRRRRSYSRSRSRSYSDYSDSFYSDDSYATRKKTNTRNIKSNASSNSVLKSSSSDKKVPVHKRFAQMLWGYNKNSTAKAKKKPPPNKKASGKNNKTSGGAVSPRNMDYVTKRMLSARRIKINELKNETEDLAKQLAHLQTENRTLRREQHLREKALERYEYEENDMANVLHKHQAEVRVLKEAAKKNKERNQRLERNLKDTEDELERTKKLLRKMKGLVEDKQLGERDELARKLSKAEELMDEKDKRVRDLERHSENLAKNHKHEMGIERARHRETNKQLNEMQEKYDKLQIQLREREKELEVKNIYANRLLRPPHHLNSSVSSTPAPQQPLAIRERKNSEPDMTPRDKAKVFEQKRRDQERKKKEARLRRKKEFLKTPPASRIDPDQMSTRSSVHSFNNDNETQRTTQRSSTPIFITNSSQHPREDSDIVDTVGVNDNVQTQVSQERDRREAEIRQKREAEERIEREKREELEREKREREMEDERQEREEREWRERKERERREREDRERREKEDEERRKRREEEEEERKWKEERERRKKEAEDMFNQQKREKAERERREREEEERRERDRREKEEIERRAQEERDRLAIDQAEQERRRQKELLLAKMKAIDQGNTKAQQDTDAFSLSKEKTVTKDKGGDSIFDSPSHGRKDYQFSKPIENMHSGKPAYDISDKKKKKFSLFDSEDSDEGYNPSFGTSRRGNAKPTKKESFFDSPVNSASKSRTVAGNNNNKKGDLMADLFGGSSKNKTANTKPSSNGDTVKELDFSFTSSPKKNKPTGSHREGSSTQIYGGGSAFIDDDEVPPRTNNGLLPRRMKQPSTTIHNRPTVNAVDDIEDEIEEVIL